MPSHPHLSTLSNPLATIDQLAQSSSQLDGIPAALERAIYYAGALLTQSAGILLRLPQDVIAQAIVTFGRFYAAGPEGGSFRVHAAKDISAAAIYLTAKVSFHPQSPRSVVNVYAYLLSSRNDLTAPSSSSSSSTPPPPSKSSNPLSSPPPPPPSPPPLTPSTLFSSESLLLRTLSFTTHVTTPHTLALTYLQTLNLLPAIPTAQSHALATRTLAYLNTALLSPQMLYLTHQPAALAVAAVWLAAREGGVKIGGEGGKGEDGGWWELFDVEREEVGFLVVGVRSLEGWVRGEMGRGGRLGKGNGNGRGLVTVEGVEEALGRMVG